MSDDEKYRKVSKKEIESSLENLMNQGFVISFIENGETLYKLSPKGEAWVREQEQKMN